ncbi:MAG: hypothetical protein ABSH08_17655 [Tepidisphaeraceae bacterium]|jgi:hypothetical protein
MKVRVLRVSVTAFRFLAALAELGFAEVWVTPGFNLSFRFDRGAGEHFNEMMNSLQVSTARANLGVA